MYTLRAPEPLPRPYRDAAPERVRAPPHGFRLTSTFGGLMLAVAIFMPALESCNQDDVPAAMWLYAKNVSGVGDFVGFFSFYGFAYAMGLLLALAALGRRYGARWAKVIGWVAYGLLVAESCGVVIALVFTTHGYVPLLPIVVATPICIYVLASLDLGRDAPLRGAVVTSVMCVLWFGMWALFTGHHSRYGLWISLLGSLALLVGSVGEGHRMLGRRLWW